MKSNFLVKTFPFISLPTCVPVPNWLVEVSDSKLSAAAKILYAKLASLCNGRGTVTVIHSDLSIRLGMTLDELEITMKELLDLELIGEEYETENTIVSVYVFYKHEWMEKPINENL